MSKDQAKGALKDVQAKSHEQAGKAIANSDKEVKGRARQGEGKGQDAYSTVKEALKNSRHV